MKRNILKIRHFKICPVIGFGYWKEVYLKETLGVAGITHNFILPFIRIQYGYLVIEIKNMLKLSQIPLQYLSDSNTLIDYMIDNNYTILVNDYGSGIEFELNDIEDSFEFIKKFVDFVNNN